MTNGYYKCDHCYKFFVDANLAKLHEESCLYNPKNKHCNSCANRKLVNNKNDDSFEYVCKKGYEIHLRESIVPCQGAAYHVASSIERKKRSEKPEF